MRRRIVPPLLAGLLTAWPAVGVAQEAAADVPFGYCLTEENREIHRSGIIQQLHFMVRGVPVPELTEAERAEYRRAFARVVVEGGFGNPETLALQIELDLDPRAAMASYLEYADRVRRLFNVDQAAARSWVEYVAPAERAIEPAARARIAVERLQRLLGVAPESTDVSGRALTASRWIEREIVEMMRCTIRAMAAGRPFLVNGEAPGGR